MVNGLWVTIGDDQVRKAVYKDTNDLLNFFRETNEIQKARGYYQLENYPLEAKVCLAWTGNEIMKWNPLKWQPKIPTSLVYYTEAKLPLIIYEKDTVSLDTLRKMRELAEKRNFWIKDVNQSVTMIEGYLWIPNNLWKFVDIPDLVLDENHLDAYRDVDWQFNRYLSGLKFLGAYSTEMALVDAWLKSIGISTIPQWARSKELPLHSHAFNFYYDSSSMSYKACRIHFYQVLQFGNNRVYDWHIYLPPVNQRGYLWNKLEETDGIEIFYGNYLYAFRNTTVGIMKERLTNGIPSSEMKTYILYSR